MRTVVVSIIALLFLASCSSSKLYYHKEQQAWKDSATTSDNQLIYSLYLLGDVGDDTALSAPVLGSLKTKLDSSDKDEAGVVFLGDNLYPKGMHKKHSKWREQDELRLNVQLDAVKDFDGEIVFVPGNHDWQSAGVNGLKHVQRQEKYVQKYLDKGNVFRPSHGCPGPDVVELAPGVILIILDTQWWLHHHERSSGEKDGCEVRTTEELMFQFEHLLKKYRDQNVIVVGHHPLYSNGEHGGHFKPKDHLFPITAKKKKTFVPLPGIGSIYPYYRKFIGLRQDITHPVYQDMKRKLERAMNEYDNVVYAAGHEHNLQYTNQEAIHHIISGSGSKVTNIKYDRNIDFGARKRGYSRLGYYENGEIWLEYYVFDDGSKLEQLAYRRHLYTKKPVTANNAMPHKEKSYAGMYATVIPDSIKGAGALKRLIFGSLNRDLWTTPIRVPYLDIHNEKGGLTPIKKGGGKQTLSLRMKGGDGKQYTLRGIKKNPMYFVEKQLRGTISQDIAYDGIAASHPYASIVIPPLAKAADVYHSIPRLVYLPNDSTLGDYMEEFGGMFCLFEERPNGNVSKDDNFGNSKNVMGYPEAVENIHSQYDHVVDKKYVVRARLFDMFIGDFDRHDDQWRWGKYKEKDEVVYRPIPRDRDQAFFKSNGLVMNMAKWRWLLWYVQPFEDEIKDIEGVNRQGRHFDRSFLTEASLKDWREQAQFIQEKLTDEVIEQAIKLFPEEAYSINGEELIARLKTRREKLVETAERYYEVLAKSVDVVGTFNDDYFEIDRFEDGAVEVSVYPRKKGKKHKKKRYYHRVFYSDQTKEIVLYGLEGNDEYKVKGEVNKSILVRIVAGANKDYITDDSKVRGSKKMTRIYETEGHNTIEPGTEATVDIRKVENAFDYDRKQFEYNILAPGLSMGYNANDGFFIGPAFTYTKQGFKKEPYAQQHKVTANYGFLSQGYNLVYKFDFTDAIGSWNLAGKLVANTPLVYRYFGSNNTEKNALGDVIRMNNYLVEPRLRLHSKSLAQQFDLGLKFQHVNFDSTSTRFVQAHETRSQEFVGALVRYQLTDLDNKLNPHHGIQISGGAFWEKSITYSNVNYVQLKTELRLFFPIHITPKQTTLGFRTGFVSNLGDYTFFQANFLNGFENFRGIPRNRFSGQSQFYNNFDLRFSLFKVPNKIIPFDVGILAHFDAANSLQGNDVNYWYTSYGGGGFIKILDFMMLVGTYSVSEVDQVFTLGSKFLF
ncbi:MAG: metallophosphoesterase [Bacteroidia bacterium]|nr:metallophosphoesterase [Bacteroidia bacterium]